MILFFTLKKQQYHVFRFFTLINNLHKCYCIRYKTTALSNFINLSGFYTNNIHITPPMSPIKRIPNLSSLPRESLVELINELYKYLPEAKFMIDLRLGGSVTPLVKKFKKRIATQLAIGIKDERTVGLNDARGSLDEFSRFNPPPANQADMMLFFAEKIVLEINEHGYLWDEYFDEADEVFEEALSFIRKHNLIGKFRERCKILAAEFYEKGYDFEDVTTDI